MTTTPAEVVEWIHALYLVRRDVGRHLHNVPEPQHSEAARLADRQISEAMYDTWLGIAQCAHALECGGDTDVAGVFMFAALECAINRLLALRDQLPRGQLADHISFLIGYGEMVVGTPVADDAEPI